MANISILRSILGNLLALAIAYLFIELGTFCLHPIIFKTWFSPNSIVQHAEFITKKKDLSPEDLLRGKQSVLHPYVGYVYNPEGWKIKHDGIPISEYGYIDDKSPIFKRSDSLVIIGVFGGSVAWWYQQLGMKATLQELRKLPDFKNKKIVIVRLALGGYKQPQQLLTLSYLASQGADFDYIINLDGYNEVALPIFHNTSHGVHPIFPINWKEQLSTIGDKTYIRTLGKLTLLEDKQKLLAKIIQKTPIKFSPSITFLWKLYDKSLISQGDKLKLALTSFGANKQNLPFALSGPPFKANDKALYTYLSEVWKNSSLAMHKFCLNNGCKYYHFLQPNQYVPNSKPMSDEEKKIALGGLEQMIRGVEKGYPLLQKAGTKLQNLGVNFYDLSLVFSTTKEQVYNDSCCHLTKKGNEILGREIGLTISQQN